ncbi:hypothetical protein CsatA_030248 [Cannabis sativa]
MQWLTAFTSSAKPFLISPSLLSIFPTPKPTFPSSSSLSASRFPITLRLLSSFSAPSLSHASDDAFAGVLSNFSGVRLEETVPIDSVKVRLDSWISSRVSGISRARVQSSIRLGLVRVNGQVVDKVSYNVKAGDEINCEISELRPLKAEAEDIPLDIVYEDDSVVHPAPGNPTGTLVNGILHHCSLPIVEYSNQEFLSDDDDELKNTSGDHATSEASVRPGIVHRLDKGTSGLLVVAKDEHSHAHLSDQFKLHTIQRVYISLTSGVPSQLSGRIEVPIGRDSNNRIRMAAIPGASNSKQARHAASRYKVIEILAGGGSALVEWRLETGRTHQTLVFYKGHAPQALRLKVSARTGICTNIPWARRSLKGARIYSGLGPKNGEQYGAPFTEEEWNVDCLDFNMSAIVETPVERVDGALSNFESQETIVDSQKSLSNEIEELLQQMTDEPLLDLPDVIDYANNTPPQSQSNLVDSLSKVGLHISPSIHEQEVYVLFVEDFIEMDDLFGPEPTTTDAEKPLENF